MNKKEFLDKLQIEDKILLSNIFDKIILHKKILKPVYSNEFYPPNLWQKITEIIKDMDCKIATYGVFNESERRMICILGQDEEDTYHMYPLDLIKITNKSSFSTLKHSDFLGALMSLGIKREKFGDLILEEQSAFVPVSKDISEYVKDNLNKIGKSPCNIEILDVDNVKIPEYNFNIKNIIASSMRIDCIISSLCGISRNSSSNMIKKGMVLLNYEKVFQKDIYIHKGFIITIRGYGKFKILEFDGKTQKGREKILIKKYI